jgi:hypothetical protein
MRCDWARAEAIRTAGLQSATDAGAGAPPNAKTPPFEGWGFCLLRGSLTMTYFHTGNPHYHRREVVSRSCSGWEGVVPTRYGHQA